MDRRRRYREETRQEAKRIALAQLAADGVAGISVNAIGRRMGVTGPALYRYFANRDALLTELIADAYHDLAEAVEQAGPALRDAADAMRVWAVREPHRYLLIFGTPVPGYQAPPETLLAANRTMVAVLARVGPDPAPAGLTELDRQLAAWGDRMEFGELSPRQLHWGVTVWTRLHGVLSLEVAGHFTLTGVDPALLYAAEVDSLQAWWNVTG